MNNDRSNHHTTAEGQYIGVGVPINVFMKQRGGGSLLFRFGDVSTTLVPKYKNYKKVSIPSL
jgi:hypothetical protein